MGINYLDNQAIQLYKLSPTDEELSLGMTSWANTAYHKRLGNCGFIGPEYCNPVLQTDFLNFQFKASYGDDLFQPYYDAPLSTGTTTSTSANHLVDSGADFIGDGVGTQYIVVNTTDNTSARVTVVNSGTDLTLSSDIFVSGENYKILPVQASGNFVYDVVNDEFAVLTAGSSSIDVPIGLTVGNWYRVVINITDITAGSLEIYLGNNQIAVLNSVGTHILYGKCTVTTTFAIVSSATFLGAVSANDININLVNQDYTIAIFNLQDQYQSAIDITYDDDALTIGNILVNIEWGNFALECGCYYVAVYEDNIAPCSGQMITNGNFAEGGFGWTVDDEGMGIDVDKLIIYAGAKDMMFSNTLTCCLIEGNSYTITYTIGDDVGVKEGSYRINNASTPMSFNAALQTNVEYSFIANANSCELVFEIVSETAIFTITDFVMTCNDCSLELDDADGASEAYCVCDSHDCTILLKYRNTRNSFGNYYGDETYFNYLRLPASIHAVNITDKELIQFKSTLHQMNIPYWNGIKVEELATDLLPNWVHNAIAVALKHRVLLIDDVRYIGIAEHSPIIEKTEVFGAATKIARWNQANLNSNW